MSKLWESLAKIGLVEKVQQDPQAEVAPVQSAPVNPEPVVHVSQPASSLDAGRAAELDAMARKMLITAMQNDGAPLVEDIVDTLETLQDAISDERSRYIAAIKILVKRGSSVSALLNDFDKCLGVLETNKRTFEADTKTQLDSKVGAKIRAVESLDAQISQKNAQIEALRNEIADLAVKRDQEKSGVQSEQVKIAQVQERFSMIYSAIRSDIENKREKIAKHGEGL